jgi:anti-sigma28 factor (negative regulator of flagellin synthesis)
VSPKDTQRLEEIQRQLRDGTYVVDPDELAERIMQALAHEEEPATIN